jgi:hypothetical protein
MFIKVVETIVTQEVEPKCPYKLEPKVDYATETKSERKLLSNAEQSEYDVLYGDPLQQQPGRGN